MPRLLTIMGSGETSPTMTKCHRELFERLGPPPVPAVILDTPYGFQNNADDISHKTIEYFSVSINRQVEVASLRNRQDADLVQREQALSQLALARWVFAGPGSPSYALRQWKDSEVQTLLSDKLTKDGCVIFASAAALTLGYYSVPVYEIYKVGADPIWNQGLDLLGFLGGKVGVIPHYDNAEGGNHDTRFCYLGERRLEILESQMEPVGWILGIDEHTGGIFDLDGESISVIGNGGVTIKSAGVSTVIKTGESISFKELKELIGAPSGETKTPHSNLLASESVNSEDQFNIALNNRDAAEALRVILEQINSLGIPSDSKDMIGLRRMVIRLGEVTSEGLRDPKDVVGVFVEALLEERNQARQTKRFADADRIRDALIECGIEVHDSPERTSWDIA